MLPQPKQNGRTGRPRVYPYREILNALFYQVRSGGAWRMLPHDLPPWDTAYGYFRRWKRDGTWERIHDTFPIYRDPSGQRVHPRRRHHRQPVGEDDGKRGVKGYDAGKKVKGRKRHIVVDTLGLLLAVVPIYRDIQGRDGAQFVLAKLQDAFPRLALIWADGGYAGQLIEWVASFAGWALEIVKRPDDAQGFVVLPKRWIVERTLAWLGKYRRLSKDYEYLTDSSETMIRLAMIHIMARRLTPK